MLVIHILKAERHMTIELGHDGMLMGNHIKGTFFIMMWMIM